MWVLIILSFGGYVQTVETIEFDNKSLCMEAKTEIDRISHENRKSGEPRMTTLCVRQGV